MPQVTLRQIAQRVGCSRSTVSYALKNNPNISREMRDKVMNVARELGWKPDAELARQMALVRHTVIKEDLPNLAIIMNKGRAALEYEHSPKAHLIGAREYARSLGYHVDVFNLVEEPMKAERLKDILVARGVQGIIFIATVNPELDRTYFEIGRTFACAVAGIRYPEIPFHVALNDFLGDCHLCIMKLCEQGYRRPGIILPGGLERAHSYAYTGGVSSGLMFLEQADRLPILVVGEENFFPPETFGEIRSFIDRHRPDCLVTTDYSAIPRLSRELADGGTALPVFALDWFPECDVEGGVYCRQEQVGEAAVDIVVGQLYRGESGVPDIQRCTNIEGEWVDRRNMDALREQFRRLKAQPAVEQTPA